ncbi:hypothetical protein HK097_003344, partial [Rhizophlyctis rosea]
MEEEEDYDSGSSHDEGESRYSGEPPRKRERRDSDGKVDQFSIAGDGSDNIRSSTPKRTRASRACDQCRKRRTKCSGKTPCDSCSALEIPCTYVPAEKKRGPLPQTQQVQAMEKRLRIVETLLNALLPEGASKALAIVEDAQARGTGSIEGLLASKGPILRETRRRSIDEQLRRDADRFSPQQTSISPKELAHAEASKPAESADQGFVIVRNRNVSFFGNTSTSNNADLLEDSPAFRDRVLTIPPNPKETPFRGIETIPCPLPLIEHLSQAYFHHVQPFLPMMDQQNYLHQLRNRSSHTSSFTFLVACVTSLMAQITQSLQSWGIAGMGDFRKSLVECVRGFVAYQLDNPSLQTVQGMIVLSLCSVMDEGVNSWTYVGIAIRMAQELGLHRNLDRFRYKLPVTPDIKAEMRRTWFCCYFWDRSNGIMIGRPLGISDGDWDTPAPEPVDVQTKNLLLHVGVAKVFGDICILANSADPDDRETLYGNAHARLLKFRSSLPEEYQLNRKPITVFGNFLHIGFHTATILLHRVVHGRFDATCSDSAHDILTSVDALPDPPTNPEEPYFSYHMIPYGLMTACSLFMNEVLVRRNFQSIAHVKRALFMMQKLGHASLMARKCFQLNDEILAAKGIDWRSGEVRMGGLPMRPPNFPGGDSTGGGIGGSSVGPGSAGGTTNPTAASLMAWRMITAGGPNPRDPGMAGGFGPHVPVTSLGNSPIQQPTPAFPAPHPGMPWIAGTNVDQYS